jgi:DNA-binding beta-propeller fold protein YncE
VTTIAGSDSESYADGTGAAASFNNPWGVAWSPDDSQVVVGDRINNVVRLITVATQVVVTLAGSGSAMYADGIGTAASFHSVFCVDWSPDGRYIVVADRLNHRVRLIEVATKVVTTLAGSGSATYADGIGTAASFNALTGVAWSPDGLYIAVADRGNNRVRLIAVATQVVTTLAGSGSATHADGTGTTASFDTPTGLGWSPDGSKVAVADQQSHRVRLITVVTQVVTTLAGSGTDDNTGGHTGGHYADGTGTAASFKYPTDVAWSPDGSKVVVADRGNNRVRLIAVATQVVTTLAGSGGPTAQSYGGAPYGGPSNYADGTGAAALFKDLSGVDYSSDGSHVVVGDYSNHRVRSVCATN